MIPIIYFLKLSSVTICLSLGVFFSTNQFNFNKFFSISLKAEFIFLVAILCKILWFSFFQTNYSLNDLQVFYPLSMLNIIEISTVEPWLKYPLQILNVFEVIYCVVLYKNIEQIMPSNGTAAIFSYLVGLCIWVALVMFLTLTYSS